MLAVPLRIFRNNTASRGLQLLAEQLSDLRPGERPPDSIQEHAGRMWVVCVANTPAGARQLELYAQTIVY
jgi:hypothetical protein